MARLPTTVLNRTLRIEIHLSNYFLRIKKENIMSTQELTKELWGEIEKESTTQSVFTIGCYIFKKYTIAKNGELETLPEDVPFTDLGEIYLDKENRLIYLHLTDKDFTNKNADILLNKGYTRIGAVIDWE
jgi:hypothetical protein